MESDDERLAERGRPGNASELIVVVLGLNNTHFTCQDIDFQTSKILERSLPVCVFS